MIFDLQFLIIAVFLAVPLWFILQNLKYRESALKFAKQYCVRNDLQLLDQTVALDKIRLRWRSNPLQIHWQRTFHFQFASTGDRRYNGSIQFLGASLEHINTEPYKEQSAHEHLSL